MTIISNYKSWKQYYQATKFLSITWICFSFWAITQFLALLMLSHIWFQVSIYGILLSGFFLILSIEKMQNEKIKAIRISILGFLAIMVVLATLNPNSIEDYTYVNGEKSLAMRGSLRILQSIYLLFESGFWLEYSLRIMHKIFKEKGKVQYSKSIRLKIILNFVGSLLISLFSTIFIISGISLIVPGSYMIPFILGVIISGIIFIVEPRLTFLLPFELFRLTVIATESGIPIFNHTWDKENKTSDSIVFAGFMQGINEIVKISIQKGTIKDISLEREVILLYSDSSFRVMFMLEASKKTSVIQNILERFAEDFNAKFEEEIEDYQDIEKFSTAKQLVEKYFSVFQNFHLKKSDLVNKIE